MRTLFGSIGRNASLRRVSVLWSVSVMSPFAAGGASSCHLGSGKGAAARQPRLARCNNAAPNVCGPYARVVHGGLILALPQIVKAKNGAGKPPAPQLRSIDHLGQHTHNWVKGSS